MVEPKQIPTLKPSSKDKEKEDQRPFPTIKEACCGNPFKRKRTDPDVHWAVQASAARCTHFCFCLPLLLLLYDIVFVFSSWSRVFSFSLGGVIFWSCFMWCLFGFVFGWINWGCTQSGDAAGNFFNCLLFIGMFIFCFISAFPETQTKYQREWLKSVEATNCRFSDPVPKTFTWSSEVCR